MEKRVTQKDVARAADVHPTTVSLALRGHPSIPEETRDRLRALAQKMGYAPDPVLDALNAYRLAGHRRSFQGVIAWIDCWAATGHQTIFKPGEALGAYFEGAREKCEQTGFQLETFTPGRGGLSATRLSNVMRERGIQGVIVPPIPGGRGRLNLAWTHFASVTLSRSLTKPALHTFVPDHFESLRILLRELRHRGLRRPGLVIIRHEHQRTDNLRAAAFLMMQADYPQDHPVPILMVDKLQKAEVLKWFKKHTPDAVIARDAGIVRDWLKEAGASKTAVAGISAPEKADYPRVVENIRQLTHLAVEYLIAMIQRGERGIPESPARVTVPGRWVE